MRSPNSFFKTYSIQLFAVLMTVGLLVSCNNEQNTGDQATDQATDQMSTDQDMGDQSASEETVYHYTCPQGHAEGASNQPGTCSVCGAELTHNSAFHQQQQQGGQTQQQMQQQMQQQLQQQQQQAEPKVNDQGKKVFHYACPEGHAKGGSMQPGNCSVCGAKLTHNNAYHQQ